MTSAFGLAKNAKCFAQGHVGVFTQEKYDKRRRRSFARTGAVNSSLSLMSLAGPFARVEMNCVRYPIAAALGLFVLAGCGDSNPYNLYPISGEVTYNGKPLAEGSVVYLPAEPGGRQATGPIQPDGKFQLTTHKKNDGAAKGKYNIVIYAYEAHPGEPTSREEQEAMAQRGGIERGFLIPEKYVNPDTSGLTDTVDDNHGGFKKIELTDGGSAAGN